MAVTIYKSSDAGAPVIPAAGNYVGAKFVMELLKACLVTGYGSKAAAGWSLIYEDTTTGKHRLGLSNGNGVIEFVTWGTSSMGLYLWDSITTPGVGRINTDTYSAVVSSGVNGWSAPRTPVAGVSSELIFGVRTDGPTAANYASNAFDWTIFADDKSCWFIPHFRSGSSSALPGAQLTRSVNHYPLFFGALKGQDLPRAQQGNMFLNYGYTASSAATLISGGGAYNVDLIWGLRTPQNTAPNATDSTYSVVGFLQDVESTSNYYSSVRLITPSIVTYVGSGCPAPAGYTGDYARYAFAAIPGLGRLASTAHNALTFWAAYSAANMSVWNLETQTFNGADWMPFLVTTNVARRDYGITDHVDWWT